MNGSNVPLTLQSYYVNKGFTFSADEPTDAPPMPPPPPPGPAIPNSYVDVAVPVKHGNDALQQLIEEASRNYLARHRNRHVLFASKVSTFSKAPLTEFLTSGSDVIRDLIMRRIENTENITLDDVSDALAVSLEESPTLFFTYTLSTYLDEAVAEIGKHGLIVTVEELLTFSNYQLKTARYIALSMSDTEASGPQKSYTPTKAALKVRNDKEEALKELVLFVRKANKGEELA